ncbi:immunoglobulin-like domain-containing protein [Halolamina salina]|uniref:immunoglobulin-like domain-containing protein n=1 Tax=Halolamina salina TaxID=1220023 RepID=UPI0036173E36
MRRRALLSLSALALAGCTAPGSDAMGVPTDASDCPSVGDRIVCVPETDSESVAVVLTADAQSVSPPETVTFSLENGSDRTLSTNFYAWTLWKRADGDWYRVVPDIWREPLMTLDPGGRHEWTLSAEHDLPPDPGRYYDAWLEAGTVGGLGGGEYAFTADGVLGDSEGETLGFAARFDVDAPELTLEPTERVVDAARDGGVVTVRGEGVDEDGSRAELTVRCVETAEEPVRIIPERAAHDYRLRNTLSYFEDGVERVRYVEENHAITPSFGIDEPYAIRYEEDLYEVTTGDGEAESG